MGRILMPCNLDEQEKTAAWEEFDELLTQEEAEQVNECLDHYLFYWSDQRGKVRECVCTHSNCGRFEISREYNPGFWMHTHGSSARCPKCGGPVILQAVGKLRSFEKLNSEKWKRITVCRTGKDGVLLLMSGYVKRYFCHENLRPDPEISWKARTYLKPGKRMQWFRVMTYGCGYYWGYHWVENQNVQEPFQPSYYGEGGDSFFIGVDAIDRSALRYCQLEEWMWREAGIYYDTADDPMRNVVKYLSAYTRYPTLEMAVKLGMHHAATELVADGRKNHAALNWDASNMQGFLRLNKQDAKTFFNAGGDLAILAAYHMAKKAKITGNMMEFLSFLRDSNCMNQAQELTRCARKAGCTLRQASNYVNKMSGTVDRLLIVWDDYLNMAKQLSFDMTRLDVTMPKDLQDRHDAASETLSYHRKVEQRKKNKEFNKRLRKMYEFSCGDLCIVVPGSTEEIIIEGKTLKHCVGGYAARHFNDKVTILFLRHKRKPDTPFVTIEIIPRRTMKEKVVVRQIHGYRNEGYLPSMPENEKYKKRPEYKYKWFLDIWREWVESGSKRDKKGNPILTERKERTA